MPAWNWPISWRPARISSSLTCTRISSQLLTSCGNNVLPSANCDAVGAQNYYSADVRDKVDTFMVAVNHELIPNKLDVRLGYTFLSPASVRR